MPAMNHLVVPTRDECWVVGSLCQRSTSASLEGFCKNEKLVPSLGREFIPKALSCMFRHNQIWMSILVVRVLQT